MAEQFAQMGLDLDPSEISDPASEGFQVFPSNWESVMAFLSCETQWRVVARHLSLIWLGLEYAGVDVVLRRLNADDSVFADICEMERAALRVLSEVR